LNTTVHWTCRHPPFVSLQWDSLCTFNCLPFYPTYLNSLYYSYLTNWKF
jgi:hypothetical protein